MASFLLGGEAFCVNLVSTEDTRIHVLEQCMAKHFFNLDDKFTWLLLSGVGGC